MSKNTKVGENGYFIVTDEKGTIIASGKDESLVSKSIKELKVENLNDLSKYKNSSFSTKMGNGKEYFINVKNPLMKNQDGITYLLQKKQSLQDLQIVQVS